jgi:uncharacterized DUF497 family protein
MKIVWDEPKRQTNLATHGFDLADAEFFDWDDAVIMAGYPGRGGRQRYKAVGWLDEKFVTIVFSQLGTEAISVISMRAASREERKQYYESET